MQEKHVVVRMSIIIKTPAQWCGAQTTVNHNKRFVIHSQPTCCNNNIQKISNLLHRKILRLTLTMNLPHFVIHPFQITHPAICVKQGIVMATLLEFGSQCQASLMIGSQLHGQLFILAVVADHKLGHPCCVAQGCCHPGCHAFHGQCHHGTPTPQYITPCGSCGSDHRMCMTARCLCQKTPTSVG